MSESKLKDILKLIQELPKEDLKKLVELLRQADMQSRGSGSMSLGKIPAENLKTEMGTNTIAGALNKSIWAKEQLVKHLDAGGTIETLPAHILAFLGAEAMDLVAKRIKAKQLDVIRDEIKKRHARERGTPEQWLDFVTEEDVPEYEEFKAELEIKQNLNPNAVSKALKQMTKEPFYVRQPQAKSFGRGLSMDAPRPKKRKVLNLKGEVIGFEDVEE